MKNSAVVFFTQVPEQNEDIIALLGSTSDVCVCSYCSNSWNEVDFFSNKNVAFVFDEIPNDSVIQKDALWILSKLADDNVFSEVPALFTTNKALYDFENMGFSAFVSDILPTPFDYETARRRFDNICEIQQLKRQIFNLTKIHTKRIMSQASKLKEQNNKMRSINYDLVELLVSAIESRDMESGQHIHRIRYFTKALLDRVTEMCPEYNITPEQAENIYYASSVHDIGKIAIPDAILLKPGRLTKEEFEVMKTHTVRGYDLLEMLDGISDNDPYFRYCQEICLNHHERWDGKGYPRGLKGDDTPISAQIVAVCDCYDALTSTRPYKKALSHEDASNLIFNGAAGAFSPKLMECFKAALSDFAKIESELKSNESIATTSTPTVASISLEKVDENESKSEFSSDELVILNGYDIIFKADIDSDMFSLLRGESQTYFEYVPKNFNEFVTMCAKLCHPSDIARFDSTFNLEYFSRLVKSGRRKSRVEFKAINDGVEYIVIGSVLFVPTENGDISAIYGSFNFYTNDQIAEDLKRGYGVNDTLTGLMVGSRFQHEVDSYIQENSDKEGLLILIDIDDLNLINSAHGYEYGNNLIIDHATKLFELSKSTNCIVAKGPSDKFYLFMPDIQRRSEMIIFIERVHGLMKKSYITSLGSCEFTATMGISRYPADADNCKNLMIAADYALNSAKLNGKGSYMLYNSGMKRNLSFSDLQASNTAASQANPSFEPRFTPVVDAKTNELISYDFIPFMADEKTIMTNPEIFYSMNCVDSLAKNKSLLAIKTIMYLLLGRKKAEQSTPPFSIYTVFKAEDIPSISQELNEFANENDLSGIDVCIMLPQEFVNNISERRLKSFSNFVRSCGFKLGLYGIGREYVHNNCFISDAFNRYVLTADYFSLNFGNGYSYESIINNFTVLKSYAEYLTLPGYSNYISADHYMKLGFIDFSINGETIVGSDALVADYSVRTKMTTENRSQVRSNIGLIDPDLWYLDFIRGNSVFVVYTIKGNDLTLSENCSKVFGFDVRNHFGAGRKIAFEDLVHPADIPLLKDSFKQLRLTLKPFTLRVRVVADDYASIYRSYSFVANIVLDEKGAPERYHILITPVSEE